MIQCYDELEQLIKLDVWRLYGSANRLWHSNHLLFILMLRFTRMDDKVSCVGI